MIMNFAQMRHTLLAATEITHRQKRNCVQHKIFTAHYVTGDF